MLMESGDYAANFGIGAMFAAILFFIAVVALISLAIQVFVCWLLYSAYQAIPRQFQKQQPGLVWLLLIPCFGMVWNFFVIPKLSESFQAFFQSKGRTDVGDCGAQIGLVYCICAIAIFLPYLGVVAAVAALVLLILYLVKVSDLKKKVAATP